MKKYPYRSKVVLVRHFLLFLAAVAAHVSLNADTIIAVKQQSWHTASQISQVIVAKSIADRVGYIIVTDQANKETQIQKSLIVTTGEIPEILAPATLLNDSDIVPHAKIEQTLAKLSAVDPKIKTKVAPYLAKYNSLIKPEIERYQKGEKKSANVWYSAGDYAAKLDMDNKALAENAGKDKKAKAEKEKQANEERALNESPLIITVPSGCTMSYSEKDGYIINSLKPRFVLAITATNLIKPEMFSAYFQSRIDKRTKSGEKNAGTIGEITGGESNGGKFLKYHDETSLNVEMLISDSNNTPWFFMYKGPVGVVDGEMNDGDKASWEAALTIIKTLRPRVTKAYLEAKGRTDASNSPSSFSIDGVFLGMSQEEFVKLFPTASGSTDGRAYLIVSGTPNTDEISAEFCKGKVSCFRACYSMSRIRAMGGYQTLKDKLSAHFGQSNMVISEKVISWLVKGTDIMCQLSDYDANGFSYMIGVYDLKATHERDKSESSSAIKGNAGF